MFEINPKEWVIIGSSNALALNRAQALDVFVCICNDILLEIFIIQTIIMMMKGDGEKVIWLEPAFSYKRSGRTSKKILSTCTKVW